ncbi:extracellular matrix regulator RemB [Halarsenatibacter silvermanii]|uniref:DUF370 domain-containing protein n=1 Tax=Halarsenatibacter silvermanii TaxID=321763 RepID=A0A1G9Q6F9_9FIRM|nr:extracellular matrix/biofilm biosynthesis regulator RemA family protein [Halarsenatibacter silvermanii]SDM06596.1 protein of unknown function [Halarsenatibacter silvermanii]
MFLHIGNDNMVPAEEIVLIGDYERVMDSEISREFFSISEEEGFVIDRSGAEDKEIRSFVLTGETIYLSMISSKTLARRMRNLVTETGGD